LSLKQEKRRAESDLGSSEMYQVETLEELKELIGKIKVPKQRVKMVRFIQCSKK
jgi:hypothetical protein